VTGIGGPWDQVVAARTALGLDEAPASQVHRADLFGLDLDALAVPPALAEGRVACRPAEPDDLGLLVPWRVSYAVETLGQKESEGLVDASRRDMVNSSAGNAFV
jgi:hypothetical protein